MRYSRLSDYKIKKNIKCFCADLLASKTANILDINRKIINSYYNTFRLKIFEHLHSAYENFFDEIELDENYFGAKKGRGVAGKTPVFGLLKRNAKVYVSG